jgi:hypothetical protein
MLLFSGFSRPSKSGGLKPILCPEVRFRNIFGVTLQKNYKYAKYTMTASFTAVFIIISCNPPIRGHNTITYEYIHIKNEVSLRHPVLCIRFGSQDRIRHSVQG